MRFKPLKPLLIFLSIWIFSFSLLILSWNIVIPFFIPTIFGIYYLLKGLYKLTLKLRVEGLNYIIIGLLLISISIKLFYIYYNLLILIALLIGTFYYYKKLHQKLDSKIKYLFHFVITINIFLLLTPDTYILSKINQVYDKKNWSSKITWNDFQGKQIDSSKFSAQIYTSLNYKVNKVYNYPQAIITSRMNKTLSWKRESINLNDPRLLKHEQGHFDIAEIQTVKAIDSINNSWPLNYDKLNKIIIHFSKINSELTRDYDKYTKHSQDTTYQKVFDSLFDSELRTN